MIAVSIDHFWRRIARTSTCSLEQLIFFVGVWKAKIDNSYVFLVIKEQVFGFQISVHNTKFVQIFDATDDLLEKLASFDLFQPLLFHNIVEKFAPRHILRNEEQLFGGFDNLKKLDYVGVTN